MYEQLFVNVRKFIHIDMDCFYAAVEMRDNPTLANIPMAIGGRSHRGVLSTANYLAREFGVRSAMSNYQAKKLCPHLVIVPGRMSVYKEVSKQIRAVFTRYTDLIELLSLDEAYLDVSECSQFSGSATLIAQQIRKDIEQETGLTASAGVAPIKFLAKIASDENKPNGQCVIAPNEVTEFIDNLPLKKIPGVGKVTQQKLMAMGLEFGRDVKAFDEQQLKKQFGKFGATLWQRCQGVDERQVQTHRVRKSVGVETTFSKDSAELSVLQTHLVEHLLPELIKRSQPHLNKRAMNKLGVKVKFYDFQIASKECRADKIEVDTLCTLLHDLVMRHKHKPVRLIGIQIGLSDEQENTPQLGLFDS